MDNQPKESDGSVRVTKRLGEKGRQGAVESAQRMLGLLQDESSSPAPAPEGQERPGNHQDET